MIQLKEVRPLHFKTIKNIKLNHSVFDLSYSVDMIYNWAKIVEEKILEETLWRIAEEERY